MRILELHWEYVLDICVAANDCVLGGAYLYDFSGGAWSMEW